MSIILDADDCGWVATLTTLDTRDPEDTCRTRRFVAYMQRRTAPANDMILKEDLGDTLGPPLGRLPGDKEGIIQLEADYNAIMVYFTGRAQGAPPDAPFMLCRERIEVAGIAPMAHVAVRRIRNMARLLDDTDPRFAPYAK